MLKALGGYLAMVVLGLMMAAASHALERVATDPHDDLRSANSALIKNASKPAACIAGVMTDAAAPCPVACMVRTATAALPKADSCAASAWACAWPKQMLGTTAACPTGWTGTYGVNEEYEVRGCGSVLAETGVREVTSSGCTRTRTETKTEACPTGGGWAGAGVTKTRTVNERLETDLTTVTMVSTTDWTVSTVACTRATEKHDYTICPLTSNMTCSRVVEQATNLQLSSTCAGGVPAQANETKTAMTEHLANDLVTVVTDSTGSVNTVRTDCPAAPATHWMGVMQFCDIGGAPIPPGSVMMACTGPMNSACVNPGAYCVQAMWFPCSGGGPFQHSNLGRILLQCK